jgi:anti-anti-sigma factor
MKNNLIPQIGRSAGASILGGIILRNPFLAPGNENSHAEPAVSRDARQNGIEASKQVLRVTGYEEMTAANCNQFGKAVCAAWNGHTDVEIDMSQTRFIDCAGLGALIAVRNLTQERNGVARLMNPTSSVQQMLDLTRTGQLFDIVNTPDADLDFGPAAHN